MQDLLQEQAKVQAANSKANALQLASEQSDATPTSATDPAAFEEERWASLDAAIDDAAIQKNELTT